MSGFLLSTATTKNKDEKKFESIYTAGGNVIWYSSFRNQHVICLKLKIELQCDSGILPLSISVQTQELKTDFHRAICVKHIHCSDSQAMEIKQMYNARWTYKDNVVHTYSAVL